MLRIICHIKDGYQASGKGEYFCQINGILPGITHLSKRHAKKLFQDILRKKRNFTNSQQSI